MSNRPSDISIKITANDQTRQAFEQVERRMSELQRAQADQARNSNNLNGNNSFFDRARNTFSRESVGYARDFTGEIGRIAIGFTAAGQAASVAASAFDAFKSGITNASEYQKQLRLTELSLKATGYAAGVTTREIAQLAEKMQGLTAFSKLDFVRAGKQLSLTPEVDTKDYEKILYSLSNVATAKGMDITDAVNVYQKMLKDPTSDDSFEELGIPLSAVDKANRERLAKVGDTKGLQENSLEIFSRMGDLSEDFKNSTRGSLKSLSDAWDNTMSVMSRSLQNVKSPLSQFLDGGTAILSPISRLANKTQSVEDLQNERDDINRQLRASFDAQKNDKLLNEYGSRDRTEKMGWNGLTYGKMYDSRAAEFETERQSLIERQQEIYSALAKEEQDKAKGSVTARKNAETEIANIVEDMSEIRAQAIGSEIKTISDEYTTFVNRINQQANIALSKISETDTSARKEITDKQNAALADAAKLKDLQIDKSLGFTQATQDLQSFSQVLDKLKNGKIDVSNFDQELQIVRQLVEASNKLVDLEESEKAAKLASLEVTIRKQQAVDKEKQSLSEMIALSRQYSSQMSVAQATASALNANLNPVQVARLARDAQNAQDDLNRLAANPSLASDPSFAQAQQDRARANAAEDAQRLAEANKQLRDTTQDYINDKQSSIAIDRESLSMLQSSGNINQDVLDKLRAQLEIDREIAKQKQSGYEYTAQQELLMRKSADEALRMSSALQKVQQSQSLLAQLDPSVNYKSQTDQINSLIGRGLSKQDADRLREQSRRSLLGIDDPQSTYNDRIDQLKRAQDSGMLSAVEYEKLATDAQSKLIDDLANKGEAIKISWNGIADSIVDVVSRTKSAKDVMKSIVTDIANQSIKNGITQLFGADGSKINATMNSFFGNANLNGNSVASGDRFSAITELNGNSQVNVAADSLNNSSVNLITSATVLTDSINSTIKTATQSISASSLSLKDSSSLSNTEFMKLTMQERGLAVAQRLQQTPGLNLSTAQLSGVLGAMQHESAGFNPSIKNPTSGAYGLTQWLGSRVGDFQQFAKRPLYGSDWTEQVDFTAHELLNKESRAFKKLKETTTAYDAGYSYEKYFERPDSEKANQISGKYAQQWEGRLQNQNLVSTETLSTGLQNASASIEDLSLSIKDSTKSMQNVQQSQTFSMNSLTSLGGMLLSGAGSMIGNKSTAASLGLSAAGGLLSIFSKYYGGGGFDGWFAEGGAVSAGGYYMTGEKGPEPFIPRVPGFIVSNADAKAALAASSSGVNRMRGGVGNNKNFFINITTPNSTSFRDSQNQVVSRMNHLVASSSRYS